MGRTSASTPSSSKYLAAKTKIFSIGLSFFSSDQGRKSLRQFCETEYSYENIDFLTEHAKLKRLGKTEVPVDILKASGSSRLNFSKERQERIIAECAKLCEKFILDSSEIPISMESDVRLELIQRYKEKNFTADMFDKATKLVLHILETDVFSRYKNSKFFVKLLESVGVYV